ncbi:MAG: endonuclease, partial [Myxococcales bacterium]|nr:endonuclease [Polyangiaceae bacterium]MDW8251075.1 endonuclease [Myxococcales bacterium]
IQELSYKSSSAADLQEMTNLVLEGGGFYYREPSSAGYIPNGILSRYPILEAGSWDDPKSTNREFAWARIDVPGDRDLWAISVHLLTKDAATRDAEAKALVSLIKTKIPEEDLVTLGGDINTDVNTEPCFTTFAQQLVVQPPFPADQEGNENTSANRKKPYDWVLADPNLNMLATPVKIGAQVFPAGLVVDTRVYQPLEDLAPAQLGDSAATNMQHMGVVRDFLLPVP